MTTQESAQRAAVPAKAARGARKAAGPARQFDAGPWRIKDEALRRWLSGSLAVVEETAREAVRAPTDPFLTEVAMHLSAAGGKGIRPALVLLAAQFGDRDAVDVIRTAAAVELLHVATLYHDDVIDEASTRRGVESVNARWGNRIAILGGDYLLAKAAELCAPLGTDALSEQAQILTRMVRGQVRETLDRRSAVDPEEYYLSIIGDKTAALFVLALRLGARAAGVPARLAVPLGAYGEALGLAFQLADDIVDIAAMTEWSGKSHNADLRLGVATLPVLRAVRGRGATAVRLRKLLAAGPLTEPRRRATAARLLRRSSAVSQANLEVERYVQEARSALNGLPAGSGRDALHDLCDAVLSRGRIALAGS